MVPNGARLAIWLRIISRVRKSITITLTSMKTGWNAIPIIKIGDEYMLGFERVKLDQALRAHNLMK